MTMPVLEISLQCGESVLFLIPVLIKNFRACSVDDCVDSGRKDKRSMRKKSGNRRGKLVVVSTNVQIRRFGATHSTSRVYTSETSSEKFVDMKKIVLKHNASKRKIKGGLNPMILCEPSWFIK